MLILSLIVLLGYGRLQFYIVTHMLPHILAYLGKVEDWVFF